MWYLPTYRMLQNCHNMCVDVTQNVLNTFFKAMMETGSNMLRPQRWKLFCLIYSSRRVNHLNISLINLKLF